MFRLIFSINSFKKSRIKISKFFPPQLSPQRTITTSSIFKNTSNNPKHQLIVSEQILDIALTDASLQQHKLTREVSMEIWTRAMKTFKNRDRFQTGFIIFIDKALERMEEMKVDKEVEAYNLLLDCFPKDKFVTRHLIDIIFPPPYPAVELALKVLKQMERKGVTPNEASFDIVFEGFGSSSEPLLKCNRIMYWFNRFDNHDPYPIKYVLPHKNPFALFGLTCARIYQGVYKREDLNVHLEDTSSDFKFIYGFENALIRKSCEAFNPVEEDIIIEGPHLMYLQKHRECYYTVRGVAKNREIGEEGELLGIGLTGSRCIHSIKFWIEKIAQKHANIGEATPFYVIKELEELDKLVLSSDVYLESDVENLTTV